MEEMEMLKQLGVALDDPDVGRAKSHTRKALREEVDHLAPSRRRWSMRPKHALLAAAIATASLGGIAIANVVSDGAGVGDPASDKIPFVQDRVDAIESQLAALDTSTVEGAAKAELLRTQLTAVQHVLDQLCAEAGEPEYC